MLGHVLYRLGHFEPALEILEQALRDAGEEPPRRAQIMGDRALALGGLGRHDDAIAEAEQAVALAPQSASLNHVLGFVLYFAGRVTEAIAQVEKALELDPSFTPALRTLALAQAAAGKTDDAVDGAAARPAPEPARSRRGAAAFLPASETERFEGAAGAGALSQGGARRWARALNNQGLALRGLKRFDEARRAFKRALAACRRRSPGADQLRRVLVDLGRAAEARPLHEQALRAAERCAAARQLRHLPRRAGRADRARETLDNALAADPNNNEALMARASLDA